MKKFLSALLCAVLCLTFVGCGSGNNSGKPSGGDSGAPIGDDVYVKIVDKGLGSEWLENGDFYTAFMLL